MRGCRRSGAAIMLVGFVVIRVHEIRCGHVHGRRRLDDDLIGVDVRSQRVDDLVQGSGVLFVDIPRDLVEVVEGNFFGGVVVADDAGYVGKVVGDAFFVETSGQRGEGVVYPLVVSTCGEEGDVKLGVGGDNSGAKALASLIPYGAAVPM